MDYKGDVHTVNDKEKEDLFWGLRGGGGQLGVVIEVVKKVHMKNEGFRGKYYLLPCGGEVLPTATSCKKEDLLKVVDEVGNWHNSLINPDDDAKGISTFFLFGGGAVQLWLTCHDCDIDAIVKKQWPEAMGEVIPYDFEAGTPMKKAYPFVRHLVDGFIAGTWNMWETTSWDEVAAKHPVMDLGLGSFFYSKHAPEITAALSDVADADESDMRTTLFWNSYFGTALENKIDSAASVQKGSRMKWAVGTVVNQEELYKIYNKGAAKVPTVKFAYWNYKN